MNAGERRIAIASAKTYIRQLLPLSHDVPIETLSSRSGHSEAMLRTALWDMLQACEIVVVSRTWVTAETKPNAHLGATPEELEGMIGPWCNCPSCGAGPKHQELRNFDPMWRDGDIYCRLCGTRVRGYDAS